MSKKAWEDDKLERKESGIFLKKYLTNKYQNDHKSFILNINTEWGFGKTFFLKNLALSLQEDEYPVIYIDAWSSDYSDEPLVAIISEIDENLSPYLSRSSKAKSIFDTTIKSAKHLLKPSLPLLSAILTKKIIGISAEELSEYLDDGSIVNDDAESTIEDGEVVSTISTVISKASEQSLKNHNNKKDSIKLFIDNITKLLLYIETQLSSVKLPLFIFIDELDRCRPNYAIEMLESIKHIFGVPGIFFIVATDSKQLSNSVCAIYGDRFESERYLKRFFDQEYNIPQPDYEKFSIFLFENEMPKMFESLFSPIDVEEKLLGKENAICFSLIAKYCKLSLRDQLQSFQLLKTIILTTKGKVIHAAYLIYLVMLKQITNTGYDEFIKSNTSSKKQFIADNEKNGLFDRGVSFEAVTRLTDGHGFQRGSKSMFKVSDIINVYIEIYDKSIPDINKMERSKNFETNILNKFLAEIAGGYQVNNPPQHNLKLYGKMVQQAGQFS